MDTPQIHTLNPCSPSLGPSTLSERTSIIPCLQFIMSSTRVTRQVTSSTSNFQTIIDALADFAKTTGIDPSKNPFTPLIEQSNSPEVILQLLQGREKAFKEYRDGNQRLINCLRPVVKVLQAFSEVLGEVASQVSRTSRLVRL